METKEQNPCSCGTTDYTVVSCSGATDLGYKKGETPATERVIAEVYQKAEVID